MIYLFILILILIFYFKGEEREFYINKYGVDINKLSKKELKKFFENENLMSKRIYNIFTKNKSADKRR